MSADLDDKSLKLSSKLIYRRLIQISKIETEIDHDTTLDLCRIHAELTDKKAQEVNRHLKAKEALSKKEESEIMEELRKELADYDQRKLKESQNEKNARPKEQSDDEEA